MVSEAEQVVRKSMKLNWNFQRCINFPIPPLIISVLLLHMNLISRSENLKQAYVYGADAGNVVSFLIALHSFEVESRM